MGLSSLQKYILKRCFEKRGFTTPKKDMEEYYANKMTKMRRTVVIQDTTKSVERLIERELITGFGKKTAHKWFIGRISLTPKGRKAARALFGKQQRLPLKNTKS